MKRKIIKQANQAYTITLPINWVRKLALDEKSEVDVQVQEKSLIVSSQNRVKGEVVKIDCNGLDERAIRNNINAAYSAGFDELEIVCERDIDRYIVKALSGIMGFVLVAHDRDRYIIKDLNFGNYPNLDEIFKRIFQMLLAFYESAIDDIFGKEIEKIDDLNSRDIEINKFCLYLQRSINKMHYQDDSKGRAIFTYSYALEKIGDEIVRLWRTNIKYKIKKDKKVKEALLLSKAGLEKAFDFYFQFKQGRHEEIYSLREKVRADFLDIKTDAYTLRFLRHALKIVEDAADLTHLTMMIKISE